MLIRPLERVARAQQRLRDAEDDASKARVAMAEAIRTANEAGFSLETIGRVLNVSRQRVAQLKGRTVESPKAATNAKKARS